MNAAPDPRDCWREALRSALEREGRRPSRIGREAWRFSLKNGQPFGVVARLEGEWLMMSSDASSIEGGLDPWSILRVNGRLDGRARLVKATGGAPAQLRGEVALDGAGQLGERLDALCRDFRRGAAALERALAPERETSAKEVVPDEAGPNGVVPNDPPGRFGVDVDAWKRALGETGWEPVDRANGRQTVDLAIPRRAYRAEVDDGERGAARLSAELLSGIRLGSESRRALGLFLLGGCASLRLVRPVAADETATGPHDGSGGDGGAGDGRGDEVRLEVIVDRHPSPGELDRGLSALSLACRLLGRESALLADPEMAGLFLEIHHEKEEGATT